MTQSHQRQTADAIVAAFNTMDVDAIMSYRAPSCIRYFYPSSMNTTPHDNTTYAQSLHQLRGIFSEFSLRTTDIIEDCEARRLCLWLEARGVTVVGEYVNEYVWLLDFNEMGDKIVAVKEYSDSLMAKEFFPKLQAAMSAQMAGNTSSNSS